MVYITSLIRDSAQTKQNFLIRYPNGEEKVIFQTAEPYLVDREMSELVFWAKENLENEALHPLLVVAVFIYEFLSIHPFQDGNSRLSRLLTTILLILSRRTKKKIFRTCRKLQLYIL